ncbi:hypothetical protein NDU88_004010 [Pleurodeles waltl]|uniref:L1 transposable element RRM domain-containing protein n=1 Tax=Pleurodeles waltl TaxID=8319 RepID=A0AAV7V3H6_PLEWA|nr:hypothetical protein NDU88_004010 [Pleurodeles waltl]
MGCIGGLQTAQTNNLDKYTVQMKTAGTERNKSASAMKASESGDPLRQEIMEAIQALRSNIEPKRDTVTIDVNLFRVDLCKVMDKVTTAEHKINGLQAVTKRLENQVQELMKQHEAAAAKLEDQEGRACHNNIRITGVPEETEGCSAELSTEDLALNKLCPKRLSNYFTIERVHRVPASPPPVGAPPRTIINRAFNFRDRDAILQTARTRGDLKWDDAIVCFFPGFTLQVQRQRRHFKKVKRTLWAKDIKYIPARLRVVEDGRSWLFQSPEEAWDYLEGCRTVDQGGSGAWERQRMPGK